MCRRRRRRRSPRPPACPRACPCSTSKTAAPSIPSWRYERPVDLDVDPVAAGNEWQRRRSRRRTSPAGPGPRGPSGPSSSLAKRRRSALPEVVDDHERAREAAGVVTLAELSSGRRTGPGGPSRAARRARAPVISTLERTTSCQPRRSVRCSRSSIVPASTRRFAGSRSRPRRSSRPCARAPPSRKIPRLAERLHDRHVVADEEDGSPLAGDLAHLADALALEADVADREHLVDEQDLRLEVRRDGEGEPHGMPLE